MPKQPTRVKWHDLDSAYQYVSSGSYGNEAVLNRESGEFIWHSEDGDSLEEWPDDVDDEEKYLAVPHKRDLDLGTQLVLDFARDFLPDDFDEVDRIFSRRGAYSRFKGLLQRKGLLERWYEFENKATERALKEWCDDNGVAIEGRTAGDAVE